MCRTGDRRGNGGTRITGLANTRRVTLINLPGYGASAPINAGSIENYADHVAVTLAALHLPKATDVFGNGFGGFTATALAALDFTSALATIGNPTLITVGELDATTPPAGVAQLAAGIAGAQYRPLPGCGHCPMLEKPAELVALLDKFLG